MALTLIKSVFEPFMMDLRFHTKTFHSRAQTERKSMPIAPCYPRPKPPITRFESARSGTHVTKFQPTLKKTQASPIETVYVRSFPKTASTPLVKVPGQPASTFRPGAYFPTNWRWYAERKEPPLIKETNRCVTDPSDEDDSLRRKNLARLEELKRKLKDNDILRGSRPKRDEY